MQIHHLFALLPLLCSGQVMTQDKAANAPPPLGQYGDDPGATRIPWQGSAYAYRGLSTRRCRPGTSS